LPEHRKKLAIKLIVEAATALILVVVLLSLLALRIYNSAYEGYVEKTLSVNQSLADLISDKIEGTFVSILNNLELAGKTTSMRGNNRREMISSVRTLYDHFDKRVIGVSRMDTSGKIVATWPDTSVIGQNIANQTHVVETMRTKKDVVSCPIKTVQGYEAIVVHKAVYEKDTIWAGNVCALVSLDHVKEKIHENLNEIGTRTFILDSLGQIIYHPDHKTGVLIDRAYDISSSEVLSELKATLPKPYRGSGLFRCSSNESYIVAFSPIRIGANIWTLGVYTEKDRITVQLAYFRKELILAILAMGITIAVALTGMVFFYLRKDKGTEIITRIELEKSKNSLLKSAIDSFQMLADYGNKNRGVQIASDSLRDAGDFKFCSICNFSPNDNSISFPAVSYRDQRDRKSFFEIIDTIPQRLKIPLDLERPEFKNLLQGHTLRVTALNELSGFSVEMKGIISKLLEVLNLGEVYVIPLLDGPSFVGIIMIIDERLLESHHELIRQYSEIAIMMLNLSDNLSNLHSQSILYSEILKSLHSGIYVVDKELRLLYFNNNSKLGLNLSNKDIGRKINELMPHVEKLGLDKTYREVFRTRRIVTNEEASYLSDSAKHFVRTTLIPIDSSSAETEKVMTIIEDITRQRELAEELKDTMRELRKLASTDGLTELYNYRHFSEALPKMMTSAREAKAELCLIVLDLDNLKAYNDLGGHHYGDNLLRVVGHILTQHQSPGDIVARYGGDEFVMILKNTSLEAAKNRAELVRTSILAYPFRDEEYLAGGDVTASFGVAAFTDDVEDSDDLMRRADRALYRAKMEGKNRVRIWEKS